LRIASSPPGYAECPVETGASPWCERGNRIEEIARVGDYLVALQTYFAAVRRWPDAKITLRNRARIIEQSWED
jgi:hypothetical protein